MNKINITILLIIVSLLCVACDTVEVKSNTKVIHNVKYIDSDPFENCRSCSYGVYVKENGEKFKLPTSNEYLKQMVKGSHYDIEYEVTSFDYPEHEVLNFTISE